MQPVQVNQPIAATSSTGCVGTKIPGSAAFLVGILLFLLPFAEVKCNGETVASNTGIGIAMGKDWKETVTKNIFGNGFNSNMEMNSSNENKFQKQEANKFAIAALALGILGLLIAFLSSQGGGKLNLAIGILAAASLIAMLMNL